MCIPNRISARLIFPFCRFCKIPKNNRECNRLHTSTCLVGNAGDDTTDIIFFLDKERKLKQLSSAM